MTPQTVHWRQLRHHWELYLFFIPTLILIVTFQYFPAGSGIFHSFYRWNGSDVSEYVGFANYADLLQNPAFWASFKLAFLLGFWNVVKMIPALLVAVCIHRCVSTKMQFLYRALFVIPMVIPGLVIVLIWRSFFFETTSGYLNWFLQGSGAIQWLAWLDTQFGWGEIFVVGKNAAWLGDPRLIVLSCIIWGFPWVGSFAVLTYLAKLQGIGNDIYEAAAIDGVNWWTKFTRIELPLILGSIHLLLVFVIIDTIKDAGMILALAGIQGGPGGVATVPALFMLRKAFVEQQMGYACAVGIVLMLVVMTLQKASNLLLNWGELKGQQRVFARIAGLLLAALLTWYGLLIPWGLILFFAILPYGWIRDGFEKLNLFGGDSATEMERQQRLAADPSAGSKRMNRMTEILLRTAKHGFILFVLAFAFLPLGLMLLVSLKDNNQFYLKPARLTFPMHWENWSTAWTSIAPTVANSLFLSILSTSLALTFALGAAYFFARKRMPMSGLFWNAILVLLMLPAIANLVPLFRLLRDLNLLNTLTALILVSTSAGQVFAIFVLRNFVADIPQELFEAAEVDGASHFQQMRVVVFPLVGPILGTVGVMNFISVWNDFVLPLIVIRDHIRLPVMVELLRMAGEYFKVWGPLMAGYALASIPVIILFLFTMKFFIRGLTEGAVKG